MAFVCHQQYRECGLTKKQKLSGQPPSLPVLCLCALVCRAGQNPARVLAAGPAAQGGGNDEMLFPRN